MNGIIVLAIVLQLAIAAAIVNVWVFRYDRATPWRGGSAKNMTEEFRTYGFPDWMKWAVGGAKLLVAGLLVAGIWLPGLSAPAAGAMALLMTGAVLAHVRVRDPLMKALPALSILVMSLVVAAAYTA